MKNTLFLKSVLLVTGASLLGVGCVVREVRYQPAPPPRVVMQPPPVVVAAPAPVAEVEVAGPPPEQPAVVESVTVAPGPGFFWVGGFWAWDGRWVWRAGHYERPPYGGARWYGPHYAYRGGRHVWVRGYWR